MRLIRKAGSALRRLSLKPVRGDVPVGLVGVGGWGEGYVHRLMRHRGFDLRVCYDTNGEALSRAVSLARCEAAKDYTHLLEAFGVEGVLLVVPNPVHERYVIAALARGVACYVEKPLANTMAEAERIRHALAERDGTLMVGHGFRKSGWARVVKSLLESGDLGAPHFFEANRSVRRDYHQDWRGDPTTCPGGPMLQLGIHLLDLLYYLFQGQIEVVGAVSDADRTPSRGIDVLQGLVRLDSTVVGTISTSFVDEDTLSFRLFCERGKVVFERDRLWLVTAGKRRSLACPEPDVLTGELDEFYRMIKGEGQPSVGIDAAMTMLGAVESMVRCCDGVR